MQDINPFKINDALRSIDNETKEYGLPLRKIETIFVEEPVFKYEERIPIWFQNKIIPIYINNETNFKEKLRILNQVSLSNESLRKEILNLRRENRLLSQEIQEIRNKLDLLNEELNEYKKEDNSNPLESSFDRFIAPSLIEKILLENEILKKQVNQLANIILENVNQ